MDATATAASQKAVTTCLFLLLRKKAKERSQIPYIRHIGHRKAKERRSCIVSIGRSSLEGVRRLQLLNSSLVHSAWQEERVDGF